MRISGILALSVAAIAVGGCGFLHKCMGPQVVGSGKVVSQTRTVGNFDRIGVYGAADVFVTVGPETSVKVEVDDNIQKLIETNVKGSELRIECKGSYSTNKGIRVTIATPNLAGVSIRGSGDSTVAGIKGNSFEFEISGSGDAQLSGTADLADLSISGSGDINASGLHAKNVTASISGSGNIDAFASESFDGSVRGSGDITYSGSPKTVKKSVAGSGEIHPK
jgi:hypothetical protein